MNNETTASQPKSIGDDAQFNVLADAMCWNYVENYVNGGSAEKAQQAKNSRRNFIEYVDNFRAPAAQASATIQFLRNVCADVLLALRNCDRHPLADLLEAALRDLPASATIQVAGGVDWLGLALDLEDRAKTVESQTTERAMTAAAQGLRLMGAATIQEPVMVTDLWQEAVKEACIAACIDWTGDPRKTLSTLVEWHVEMALDPDVSGRATMVADPAGVALDKVRVHYVEGLENGGYYLCTDVIRALAATVKAVPSDALDDAQRERIRDGLSIALGQAMDCTRVWSAWGVGTMSEDDFQLLADNDERLDELVDAVAVNLAAPLADKTGVGE